VSNNRSSSLLQRHRVQCADPQPCPRHRPPPALAGVAGQNHLAAHLEVHRNESGARRQALPVGPITNSYRFPLTVRSTATELHTVGAFVVVVVKCSADILPALPISTTSTPVDGTMPGKPANPVRSQNTCNSSATSPTSRDTGHCCFSLSCGLKCSAVRCATCLLARTKRSSQRFFRPVTTFHDWPPTNLPDVQVALVRAGEEEVSQLPEVYDERLQHQVRQKLVGRVDRRPDSFCRRDEHVPFVDDRCESCSCCGVSVIR
jgi:hypothetical protein